MRWFTHHTLSKNKETPVTVSTRVFSERQKQNQKENDFCFSLYTFGKIKAGNEHNYIYIYSLSSVLGYNMNI